MMKPNIDVKQQSPITNLKVFTSNRMEILADQLAEILRAPLGSPLDGEIIVVQSRGMERWLSMQLADRHGICANIIFPFPNTFVAGIMQRVFPHAPESQAFDPEIMSWRIMKYLPVLMARPGFESLRNYLGKVEGDLKRFQLSERIAGLFDQYLLYRPEMILKWDQGQDHHWQAVLWRELVRNHDNEHRAALGKALLEFLRNQDAPVRDFPERVCVFGISTLPVFHLQVFAALSRFMQVNLFLMNPCREYWGDISSDWEMDRLIQKTPAWSVRVEDLHLEKGNSLLASMGTLGREFFDLINTFDCDDIPCFEDCGDRTLLSCIQSDILNLRERPLEPDGRKIISADDDSIQIHTCHSPMREVEVLYDRLLDMFDGDTDLKPGDVLVMTPDIESYAPFIQAVFDVPEGEGIRIPFSIADRSARAEGRIIETFLAIMGIAESRFSALEVLTVLESPAVRNRFDLSGPDLERIRTWVAETRVRWGIDSSARKEMGLPEFSENTWQAGMERLLLGYAMPGDREGLFRGILPFDNMEGSDTVVLGKFLAFLLPLFSCAEKLARTRTISEWSDLLENLLDTFFLPDDDMAVEDSILRRKIRGLSEEENLSGMHERLSVAVIRHYLEERLERAGFGFGFMTGGVTFCAMLPMRSIPFRVICLIGMNGDSYPRQPNPLGFDLMAKAPKKGDRSRRTDDRYLFLEALLSAREKLHISYVGQSVRDNTSLPPSVLVSELMDYIEKGFEHPEKKILDHVVIRHRLQPFNPGYFRPGGRLFSYSRQYFDAAGCLVRPGFSPTSFISEGIREPGEEWQRVDVADLCRFFTNPAKFLLKRRLGLYLDEPAFRVEEKEPFRVAGLDRYSLGMELVEKKLAGTNIRDLFPSKKAAGLLPHGTIGECQYHNLCREIEAFSETLKPYVRDEMLAPLEVDLPVSGLTLAGNVGDIYPETLVRYRYARIKARHLMEVWLCHLILNHVRPPGYPLTSLVAGLDRKNAWTAWEFAPVTDAMDILAGLVNMFRAGLTRPVHFFPESSLAFAEQIREKKKSNEEALKEARKVWEGNDFNKGEMANDPYYCLCFRTADPLDTEFQNTALEIFTPLIDCRKKLKPGS